MARTTDSSYEDRDEGRESRKYSRLVADVVAEMRRQRRLAAAGYVAPKPAAPKDSNVRWELVD